MNEHLSGQANDAAGDPANGQVNTAPDAAPLTPEGAPHQQASGAMAEGAQQAAMQEAPSAQPPHPAPEEHPQPAQTVGDAIPPEALQRGAAAAAGEAMGTAATAAAAGMTANAPDLDIVMRIPVTLQAVLGEARMSIARLMQLGPGSVVPLDHKVGDPVDVVVNGRLVARGEVVLLEGDGERFGISLTEIVSPRRDMC